MLFADWEVRIVKNCDRGLEMASNKNPSFIFYLFIFFTLEATIGTSTC